MRQTTWFYEEANNFKRFSAEAVYGIYLKLNGKDQRKDQTIHAVDMTTKLSTVERN